MSISDDNKQTPAEKMNKQKWPEELADTRAKVISFLLKKKKFFLRTRNTLDKEVNDPWSETALNRYSLL